MHFSSVKYELPKSNICTREDIKDEPDYINIPFKRIVMKSRKIAKEKRISMRNNGRLSQKQKPLLLFPTISLF